MKESGKETKWTPTGSTTKPNMPHLDHLHKSRVLSLIRSLRVTNEVDLVPLACKDASGPSEFIWDFRKATFSFTFGKHFIQIGKISAKIHEIDKIKAIFGLGMTPI